MRSFSYKDKGYGTALDDIGSGYSTIASLLSLDTDYMKIDMDLIKNIDKNIENQQKVRMYIQIAKENHIISLAEGVETKEELDILMEMGIELVQGYYFAKPSEIPPKTLLNQ
ncbi:EAL domain-containing protein [Acetoanaerobium noterae]|uniref:EAL domain-containing protein n=1 Tax=Acetoanaerobium noterae TaxID=745369 RepID=UPI0032215151